MASKKEGKTRRVAGMSGAAIPTVDFYGDAAEWSTSALLHSEPLFERSRLHAWRIRPHRHDNLLQLFWLRRGSGGGRFDGERQEIDAPCVVVIPERCVHEFEWRQDSEGFALSLASVLMHELRQQLGAPARPFDQPRVIPAGKDATFVDALFEHLHEEYVHTHPMKEMLLDNLSKCIAIWVARHGEPTHGAAEHANRASFHFARFTQLLERPPQAIGTVADYAKQLGITPSHLNAICRQSSGTSALHLIHERVLLNARRELTYTDKSIADVAADLGFTEPSYFTRFFKRNMRMTPKQYRRRSGTLAG